MSTTDSFLKILGLDQYLRLFDYCAQLPNSHKFKTCPEWYSPSLYLRLKQFLALFGLALAV